MGAIAVAVQAVQGTGAGDGGFADVTDDAIALNGPAQGLRKGDVSGIGGVVVAAVGVFQQVQSGAAGRGCVVDVANQGTVAAVWVQPV